MGRILGNRAVTRETAGSRDVDNRLPSPSIGSRVHGADAPLGLGTRPEIGKVQAEVALSEEGLADRFKYTSFVTAEVVAENQIQSFARFRLVRVVPGRVVPPSAIDDLFCCKTEEEDVVFANLLSDLDGRAVTCANGQRAVHHEFHVAGATRLVTRWRNLL